FNSYGYRPNQSQKNLGGGGWMTHYKLTDETITTNVVTLHRIELTQDHPRWGKAGTKGGFIQSTENLTGDAWVGENARVYGNACIGGSARVYGTAHVFGSACVYGSSR
ncbi:hypothetical protein RZS08_52260, partial [Arthrospira platensis SPKY1]|nr:hypothetical protein [Arthrospira platensis SPKY1]